MMAVQEALERVRRRAEVVPDARRLTVAEGQAIFREAGVKRDLAPRVLAPVPVPARPVGRAEW